METKLQEELNRVLSGFPQYWDGASLLKNKVIRDIRNYKEELLESLLTNEIIARTYSVDISGNKIFKVDDFISMLRYRKYWGNSYTKFSTEIGLTVDSRYIKHNTDVVLDFPYKDCVLEGGMASENKGRKEVFYHKRLAKEEIDTLFASKVFHNIKKFDSGKEHEVDSMSISDNLILKGNNLIALHSLKKRFAKKVQLIYIDPPYNTGGDSFKYNDQFNHSTWLTFMQNRLEVARNLLKDGGSIWISIDDNEAHYLKVMMDSIFPDGFIANVIWQKRTSPDSRAALGDAHEHILVYTNNKEKFKKNLKTLPFTEEQKERFKNPDNDPRGPWVSSDFTAQGFRPNQMYKIITPSGAEYSPSPGNCWKKIESEYQKLKEEGRMWFGKNGDAMPRRKTYLAESPGRVSWTWWPNKEVGHNQEAKKESISLFGAKQPFTTPKPERLLQRIISLCTEEKDIVLDFFAGSGTTVAVAHKMNRQYIGIEQITYEIDYMPERLKKVIEGEQGGISKSVNWQGGGSFVYAELYGLNHHFVPSILEAKSHTEIDLIITDMMQVAFFDYKVNLDRLTNEDSEFKALSLEEKKQVLIESLDANQMYLSYSEIDDEQYSISEPTKQFNHSFYKNQ
ncbi:cytosine methyltransferase [Bacillus pseudomycoides]|uniref:site-specific DNA-methyltransferase n=1 Tax=Bacillus wiedmannii TaxID=1890302 RepID=UPI000BED376A|nr:site-specific DNA-methyltransferase [Bacillus wiedmannii]PEA52829.1 cytosine methyltransferase [Bacillus pseudomycoides]PHF58766.1 cytosine methyltransferase [Bacillus wiedmannii]HDR4685917.1 site-specific DNA-methyltransferase [Bacillus cereus]